MEDVAQTTYTTTIYHPLYLHFLAWPFLERQENSLTLAASIRTNPSCFLLMAESLHIKMECYLPHGGKTEMNTTYCTKHNVCFDPEQSTPGILHPSPVSERKCSTHLGKKLP